MTTLIEYYHHQVHLGLITPDQAQLVLLAKLETTHAELCAEHKKRMRVYRLLRRPRTIKGHYLWGGVGIGKTFVMDCFFNTLPMQNKLRVHFHEFMRDIHLALKQYQGKENSLALVAKELASRAMVICLDELIVTDIADAMILCRLLQALIDQGVCLILTSNTQPDDLYKNGLQRISFMPAIDLINNKTQVTHLATLTDYRLQHIEQAGMFNTPDDDIAESNMEKYFALLSGGQLPSTHSILVCQRHISIKKQAGNCIWFDFKTICAPPRSQHDYLAIAKAYKNIFISHIPQLSAEQNNIILLFIRMIDVFYDARVHFICSAATTPEHLYTQGRMLADYQRTRSRLIEMQSLFV